MDPQKRRDPESAPHRFRAQNKNSAPTISPIHVLLDRLTHVKQTRPNRWHARCPAHDDRSPSLGITETPDGTVLIICRAGCYVGDVVASVGLELKDLFPPRFDGAAYQGSKPPRYSAIEVVKTVITEATILELAYRTLERGDQLNDQDHARVELAIQAIDGCREVTR